MAVTLLRPCFSCGRGGQHAAGTRDTTHIRANSQRVPGVRFYGETSWYPRGVAGYWDRRGKASHIQERHSVRSDQQQAASEEDVDETKRTPVSCD